MRHKQETWPRRCDARDGTSRVVAHSYAHLLLHDGRRSQGRDGERLGRGRRSRAATRCGKSSGEGGCEG